ncbi:signal peptidase I [Mucilaginibacter antarcticus]|uniref:signal peptidase I n=1 Tax=Mucilaginibacter antarcticus TaxID=1855725 RepID=UPI0036389B5A
MKRPLLIVLTAVGTLIIAAAIVYLTRAVEIYTVATNSNEPTLKNGSWVIASRLKNPDRGNFVAFEKDKYFWLFRCLAKGGDMVEIRNATIYVNGKLISEPYTMKDYYITTKEALTITDYLIKNNISAKEYQYNSALMTLSDDQFKDLKKT